MIRKSMFNFWTNDTRKGTKEETCRARKKTIPSVIALTWVGKTSLLYRNKKERMIPSSTEMRPFIITN